MTKLLHFIWYQGFYSTPEQIRPVPDMWEEANEGYSYHFWDQWSLLGLIKSKYPEYFHFYLGIGSDEPENIRIIKRCDFARLLVLHAYGGWYLDMDCVPVKPIKSLLDSRRVDHLHTQFKYSSFASGRSDLGRIASDGRAVDFESYDLILTREHGPSPEVGGHTVCNGVMYATPGSSVLADLIDGCVKRVDQKVLKFAGPHGISSHLRQMISAVKGKVLALPPYYFLWQTSDMGPPWANTICCHMNRLDWADKSLPKPWDI